MADSKEELKSLLIMVKEDIEKASLKTIFKKWSSWYRVPPLRGQSGEKMKPWQTSFFLASQSLWMVTAAMKLKGTCSLEEKLWKHWQHVKEQRHHFTNKGSYCQSYGFFRQSSMDVNVWAQRRLSTKDLILFFIYFNSVQFSSVAQSCPTLWTPWISACQASLSITSSRNLLKTHVHWVSDARQPSHPLSFPSPPAKYCSFSFSNSPSDDFGG